MGENTEFLRSLRRATAYLWLILFILSYAIMAVLNTMIPDAPFFISFFSRCPYYLSLIRSILFFTSIIGIILNYAVSKNTDSRKQLMILIMKLTVLFMLYYIEYISTSITENYAISLLILFAITADNWEEDRILKIGFYIGTAVVILAFFMSMFGIIENNRNTSFGFTYRTHYACFLLSLALFYAIIHDGRFSRKGELGLIVLLIADLFLIKGKTCAICLALLIAGSFWRHHQQLQGIPFQNRDQYGNITPFLFKIIYFPISMISSFLKKRDIRIGNRKKNMLLRIMAGGFIIWGLIIILTSVGYRSIFPIINQIPGLGSVKARLFLGNIAFEEFPITLWGNIIPLSGNSGSEHAATFYYALDSAYVMILMQFGLIPFLIVIGLLTFAQIRLIRAKRYFAVFVLFIYALDNSMEYWMYYLPNDLFILLSFCAIKPPVALEAVEKCSISKRKQGFTKYAAAVAAVLLCCCFSLWFISAYWITSWRGSTPEYGGTIVVPGRYVDSFPDDGLEKQRLIGAGNYMRSHEDAMCIVYNEDAKKKLIMEGIDSERILVDQDSESIDDMLLNADSIIQSHDLPNRLTVCTYDMQQALVSERAEKLHIPINDLTVIMPKEQYIKNYTAEQWKLLCTKVNNFFS